MISKRLKNDWTQCLNCHDWRRVGSVHDCPALAAERRQEAWDEGMLAVTLGAFLLAQIVIWAAAFVLARAGWEVLQRNFL